MAVACSGGADSLALALLTHDWATQDGTQLTALTVDHGLRAESAAEAQQVAHWCAARGIAHVILMPSLASDEANPQAAARQRRYDALAQWCAANHVTDLLLGHHADDQAETVALQQHRGDSPPSRAGMALVAHRGELRLIRPLLGTRKRALIAYLQTLDHPWIDDPSNQSDRYARNRLRKEMDDATITRLWHEAQVHGQQRHADDVVRNAWFTTHATPVADGWALDFTSWEALPDITRTDILSRAIQSVGGKSFRPRHHETARLDARLRHEAQGTATLGHCLIHWQRGGAIRMGLEPQRAAPHIIEREPLKTLASEPFWWFNYPLVS